MDQMTREKAIKELALLNDAFDIESAHIEADRILCELLSALGYDEVVVEWTAVAKWYA